MTEQMGRGCSQTRTKKHFRLTKSNATSTLVVTG
jgi:hypothetical protein